MNRAASIACALLLFASVSHAAGAREWRFTAYLDDKPIGHHHFRLTEARDGRELVSTARFDVKVWFVRAYRYVHDNREHWQGRCLARMDSETDDNGRHYRVRGRETEAGFVVDTTDARATLPDCVWSFAYWDRRIVNQTRLLNAQNGEYVPVRVRDRGPDTIPVRGTERQARRYRLEGDALRIDLWYSTEGEWLALDSVTEGGRRLRYRIE